MDTCGTYEQRIECLEADFAELESHNRNIEKQLATKSEEAKSFMNANLELQNQIDKKQQNTQEEKIEKDISSERLKLAQ